MKKILLTLLALCIITPATVDATPCTICNAPIEEPCPSAWFAETECPHRQQFHHDCLGLWFIRCSRFNQPPTCPLCRLELHMPADIQHLQELYDMHKLTKSFLFEQLYGLANPLNTKTINAIIAVQGIAACRVYLTVYAVGGRFCWQCGALPRNCMLQKPLFTCGHPQHYYCDGHTDSNDSDDELLTNEAQSHLPEMCPQCGSPRLAEDVPLVAIGDEHLHEDGYLSPLDDTLEKLLQGKKHYRH